MTVGSEPVIKVGLITAAPAVRFALEGRFVDLNGEQVAEGNYSATAGNGLVGLRGAATIDAPAIALVPSEFSSSRFTVHGVKIGIEFHWEREESQQFQGALKLCSDGQELTIINELPLESYLVSVISSEMSASCPRELLRAHAIVSRSWLVAQLSNAAKASTQSTPPPATENEIIRWYDRQSHRDFDVCADDHCQRYQGISKAFSQAAFDAVSDTRGKVLAYDDEVCDARYSKSCGGMTERYGAAWEDKNVPYLKPVYDGPRDERPGFRSPLSVEANAEQFITGAPRAYCGAATPEILERILPGLDQQTQDFYRWRVEYSRDELRDILHSRIDVDFGRIQSLEPLERGDSGRIIRLKIAGEARTLIIGKELEIRRALSRSHLYSSDFVVRTEGQDSSNYPSRFRLIGAGWGHGVGLCQIGAGVMAERRLGHAEILAHYFSGAELKTLY